MVSGLRGMAQRNQLELPSDNPIVISDTFLKTIRVPYALRRVPVASIALILPDTGTAEAGDIVLARVEKVGKNTRIELASGRPCALHGGDLVAVVFGNRYATMQFEGYARRRGDDCDLMSMGGLCGVVESKHDSIADSTKLRLLGAIGDASGRRLRLRDFSVPQRAHDASKINVVVVCGTSMDAGKTYTASSLIQGFRNLNVPTAAIKLTGTAAGRDTWSMLDAGACVALDFIDGGFPSTYLTTLDDLLELYKKLVARAAAEGAEWIVVEIADGLLQVETAALLQSRAFTDKITAWVFAAGDPLSAAAGVQILSGWGIKPVAISGRVTMSPLAMREAQSATGLDCLTAGALQSGTLSAQLLESDLPRKEAQSSGAVPAHKP